MLMALARDLDRDLRDHRERRRFADGGEHRRAREGGDQRPALADQQVQARAHPRGRGRALPAPPPEAPHTATRLSGAAAAWEASRRPAPRNQYDITPAANQK